MLTTILPFALGAAVGLAVLCAVAGVVGSVPTPEDHLVRRWVRANRVRLRPTVAAVVVGGAAGWVTGWPVAGLATAVGVIAVPRVVRHRDARQAIARLEALAAWTRRIVDLLGSGAGGLERAITSSARTAPEPIATEVASLAGRIPTRGLEAALQAFADDLADPAADEVVMALILRSRAGGRGLTEILHDKATALADAVVARREIEAEREKPRATVRAMLWITAAVVIGMFTFAGDYLAPLGSLLGQLVMTGAVAISAVGLWRMWALCRPPTAGRLLTNTRATPPSYRRRATQLVAGIGRTAS